MCDMQATDFSISMELTGKRIRALRRERKLSISDLADFFGYSLNALYKWETGKSLPSLDSLYALAAYFEVSLDEVIVGNRDRNGHRAA